MRGFRRLSYSPTLPRTALFWARGWLVRPRGQLLGSTARAGPACTITRLPATEENQRSNKQSGVHLMGAHAGRPRAQILCANVRGCAKLGSLAFMSEPWHLTLCQWTGLGLVAKYYPPPSSQARCIRTATPWA